MMVLRRKSKKSNQKGFTLLELMIASAILSIIISTVITIRVADVRREHAAKLANFLVAVDKAFFDAEVLYGDYPRPYSIPSSGSPTGYLGPLNAMRLVQPFTDTWTWVTDPQKRREIPRNIMDPRINLLSLSDYEFYLYYVNTTDPNLVNVFEISIFRTGGRPLTDIDNQVLRAKLGNKYCIHGDGSGRFFLNAGLYSTDSRGRCTGHKQQEGFYTIRR